MSEKSPQRPEIRTPKTADKKEQPRYEREEVKPGFFNGAEGELEKQRREQENKIRDELDRL